MAYGVWSVRLEERAVKLLIKSSDTSPRQLPQSHDPNKPACRTEMLYFMPNYHLKTAQDVLRSCLIENLQEDILSPSSSVPQDIIHEQTGGCMTMIFDTNYVPGICVYKLAVSIN